MKILVLDNYDSFVYNLVHIIKELGYGEHLDVIRNDKISLEAVEQYDKILLSPGPGLPSEAGIMMDLIRKYASTKSILGICLGYQGIGEVFNARLYNMPEVLHGMADKVVLNGGKEALFEGVPSTFGVCRYHSWAIHPESITSELLVTARDEHGGVMAISHHRYNVKGLQFHPESILTEHGKQIMTNWLKA